MKFNLRIAVFALILSFVAVQAQAQWNSDFYHGAVQPNAQRPMNPGQTRANEERERRPSATGQTRAARYGALIVAAERYVNLPSLSG